MMQPDEEAMKAYNNVLNGRKGNELKYAIYHLVKAKVTLLKTGPMDATHEEFMYEFANHIYQIRFAVISYAFESTYENEGWTHKTNSVLICYTLKGISSH